MKITGTKILAKTEQRYNYDSEEVLLEQISTSTIPGRGTPLGGATGIKPGGTDVPEGCNSPDRRPAPNPAKRNDTRFQSEQREKWHS